MIVELRNEKARKIGVKIHDCSFQIRKPHLKRLMNCSYGKSKKKKKHEQKWIICAHGIAMSVWLGKNKAMIANDLKCYSMISIVVESLFLLMLLLWLLLLWLVCNGEWSEISMNVRDWVEECARVVLFIISPFNMQAKYIHWKWMNI